MKLSSTINSTLVAGAISLAACADRIPPLPIEEEIRLDCESDPGTPSEQVADGIDEPESNDELCISVVNHTRSILCDIEGREWFVLDETDIDSREDDNGNLRIYSPVFHPGNENINFQCEEVVDQETGETSSIGCLLWEGPIEVSTHFQLEENPNFSNMRTEVETPQEGDNPVLEVREETVDLPEDPNEQENDELEDLDLEPDITYVRYDDDSEGEVENVGACIQIPEFETGRHVVGRQMERIVGTSFERGR